MRLKAYVMIESVVEFSQSCLFKGCRLKVVVASAIAVPTERCVYLSEIEGKSWYSMKLDIHLRRPRAVVIFGESLPSLLVDLSSSTIINVSDKLLHHLESFIILLKLNFPALVVLVVGGSLVTLRLKLVQNLLRLVIPERLELH